MKDYLPGLEPTSHMSNQPVLSTNVKAFQSQPTWKKKKQIHIADMISDLTLHIYSSCLTPSSYLGRHEIDAVRQDQLP